MNLALNLASITNNSWLTLFILRILQNTRTPSRQSVERLLMLKSVVGQHIISVVL